MSIFLQVCSTWGEGQYSYFTVPLYYQYFRNIKINLKKLFALILKFHVLALLMHFMNRFCCRLWASRLTNIFPLIKNFMIFKGNMQKSDTSRKIKFCEIRNFMLLVTKISSTEISWKALERLERN